LASASECQAEAERCARPNEAAEALTEALAAQVAFGRTTTLQGIAAPDDSLKLAGVLRTDIDDESVIRNSSERL
jgi:hypothetical protein